jgi:tetratricopeptide (TPR) repeat protein
MIQIPQSAPPVTRFMPEDANEPADEPTSDAGSAPAQSEAQNARADSLPRFGAPSDVHPGVEQFAYAAPDDAGGGQTETPTPTSASAPAATTDTALRDAKVLMDRGIKLLNERRYAEALEAFQEGFRVYPDPAFILNQASTLFDAGRYAEAALKYEQYLSDPDAPRADEARDTLERARAKLGGREVTLSDVAESKRLFEKGALDYQAGRYEEALAAFEQAYELNPVPAFKYNQAGCLEKLGRPYAAADRYLDYASADPKARDAFEALGRVDRLRAQGDTKPITATGAAGGQEWITRGNRLLAAHRYNEAVEAYREGFRTYPDRAFILNEASALLDGGRFAEADQAYSRYLADPQAPRADEARAAQQRAQEHMNTAEASRLFEQGEKAYAAGNYEQALDYFERAHELRPIPEITYNEAACLQRLGRPYAAAERFKAYLTEKPDAEDATKTRAAIEKLLAKADKEPITATGLAGGQEWILRGNRLLAAHRSNEAVEAYREGFRTYPDRAFILNEAAALLDAGRYAEADLTYQTYLSDPDAPRADEARAAQQRAREHMGGREATATGVAESGRLFESGTQLYKAGRYAEALEAFGRAYALNPLAQLRFNEAACLEKLGKRELAAQKYEAYLAEAPNPADAKQVQGRIAKLHNEALTAAREAFDRGQAAFRAGRFEDAANEFAAAYEQKPLPEFLFNRASALDKGGDSSRAIQNYQLYLSMAPNAADADKVRARIHELQRASGTELMQP